MGLVYEGLHNFHTKGMRTPEAQELCMHKNLQMYQSMPMFVPAYLLLIHPSRL